MEIRELVLELCLEAGDTAPEDEIVYDWESNHGCCCLLRASGAANGDVAALAQIRLCMDLSVRI